MEKKKDFERKHLNEFLVLGCITDFLLKESY